MLLRNLLKRQPEGGGHCWCAERDTGGITQGKSNTVQFSPS